MPGVGKKADAVADRSGVPLLYNLACLYRSLPLPEGKAVRLSRISSIRHRHLAGRVPRAKRLGRSGRSEIPVQETCTQRRLIDRYDFKVPAPAPCRSGIPGAKQDRGGISKNAEMRLAIPKSSGMLKESAT